jgi:hypothetical protein
MHDQEFVTVLIPAELAAFARACTGSDDITECVVMALELLRRDIEELARELDSVH